MAQINKPNTYFNTVLYTGNGSTQSITGVNFQPDFVWIKKRNASDSHYQQDAVRGATKAIKSNSTDAEVTDVDSVTSFNSDGFSLGTSGGYNSNTNTFVAWNWLAGGTASSNTDGSITSSVSANTTSGFSIVSYTGTGATATVGHGLGVAPKMIIVKQRSAVRDWVVGHSGIGWTKYLYLNSTQASATGSFFNNTTPSSTFFNVINDGGVNASGGTYIAYCFAEKKGFSKFGSYTGNGSSDGPFIYTGFKPALLIYKGATGPYAADNWEMHTNKTDTFNPMNTVLYPNLSIAESNPASTTDRLDFLSNGFKIRTPNNDYNNSSTTYVYMAFAENPLVGTNNIPATAR